MPNEEIVMLSILGRFYSSQRQFDKANEYYNRVDLNKDGIEDTTRYNYFYRKAYMHFMQGNRLEVFKNQFAAKKYAVASNNPKYIAEVSQVLGGNFKDIKEFEKAITYFQTAKKEFEKIDHVIGVLNDDNLIADAYRQMKNYSVAEKLFEDVIKKAELTSNFNFKYVAVFGIWMIYYDQNELIKAAAVGKKYKLEDYFARIGDTASFFGIKALYEYIGNNQDSADFYYRRSIDYAYKYSSKSWIASKIYDYADYLKYFKRYAEALPQMKLSLAIYDSIADIRNLPLIYQNLDSVYSALGDYKNAWQARGNYYLYRDSLDNLSKKEDILREEIAAEEESMKKAEEAEIKAIERKHDIQYRVIILGAILLLIGLLAIGFFHPPNWLVKGLTFVSFIFIFEFIILILDSKLHHWFHGAPLPILGVKVLIACLLVPLHHLVEKKVIHFLQSKKLHRLKTVFKDDPQKTV
jgi:tetratricopeptide (TPR) repeat protein